MIKILIKTRLALSEQSQEFFSEKNLEKVIKKLNYLIKLELQTPYNKNEDWCNIDSDWFKNSAFYIFKFNLIYFGILVFITN